MREAKEEGIRQGIWLCIQRLVHMERYDMAKHFIRLFGFDRNECEMLLDKNGSDDKMESFIIQMVFNKGDKIILDDIGYRKDTHCIDVDRKDDIDVIYKKVKRS